MRRLAVTLVFFANGALFASVLPHLPTIKERAGLDDPALGAVVAAASVGALIAGPVAGRVTRGFGAGPVVATCILIYCAVLWLPAELPSAAGLAAVFALFGILDAIMDVALNTMALAVQRSRNRPMINGFHAWWSIGAVSAGAAAAACTSIGVSVTMMLAVSGAVLAAGTIALLPAIWRQTGVSEHAAPVDPRPRRRLGWLALLGTVALLVAFAEDVPSTWSAVYVRDELDAGPGLAAGAYLAFVAAMTVARLLNDRLIERFGTTPVVRTQAALLVAALAGAALSTHPATAIAAFALAGAGVSALYPTVLTAAGTVAQLAYVTWVERIGFLLAPVLVGAVAGWADLRAGILLGALAGVALIVLSARLIKGRTVAACCG
ncbi:MFS transporter [Actinoplanes solisilvae]|uniref:MFS transporter n=1 Tax=Actinoplanes solisilvae TaxID=2486853 RepID=UPI0013E298B1|nr:MFS transporter [Actinoplanes solisilvae]